MTTTLHPTPIRTDEDGHHRWSHTTRHTPRRRGVRALIAIVVAAVLVAGGLAVWRWATSDARRDYVSSNGWPTVGQGAYAFGDGALHVSPHQRPVPIASLAKVMTAYLVLRAAPLRGDEEGPTLLVTAQDVADTARRRTLEQSLVPLRAGTRLSERQALLAVLLPSANNVAAMITRFAASTQHQFVERMNATARRLGMTHTHYTDPSGYDDRTTSTAADQLLLARTAGADPTLAAMMSTREATIPVAGRIENTDVLLGHDGFVGMKTGSDDAAGGCFMFHIRRTGRELWGVVLGQPGRNLILSGQYAARQLARDVLPG